MCCRHGARTRYADDYIYCRANLTAAGEPVEAVEARFTRGGCACADVCVRSLQQQQPPTSHLTRPYARRRPAALGAL